MKKRRVILKTKMNKDNILWLNEIQNNDFNLVGGKAFNLSKMYKAFPVPNAFCITTDMFKKYIDTKKIAKKIEELDLDNYDDSKVKVQKIQDDIFNINLSIKDKNLILENFDKLNNEFVSVRSSGTAEDLPNASFAGQHDSFLNVNRDILFDSIIKCFMSLYSLRAIYYRDMKSLPQDVSLCVIVQEMIDADSSGIIHSKNPFTNKDEIIIDVAHGQGELIVSGRIEPDNIIIKKSGEIEYNIGAKKELLTRDGIRENYLSFQETLSQAMIADLVEITRNIVDVFKSPQDIEFSIFNNKIYILQARPITV